MGFDKSLFTIPGYIISFKTSKNIKITPIAPQIILGKPWSKLPKDKRARINPEMGIGNFSMKFILIKDIFENTA